MSITLERFSYRDIIQCIYIYKNKETFQKNAVDIIINIIAYNLCLLK